MPQCRRRATAGALLGLLLATGCSDGADDAAGLPSLTAAPSASPTETTSPSATATPATPTTTATPSTTATPTSGTPDGTASPGATPSAGSRFGDITRNDIVAGRTAGSTAAEKQVTAAWLEYWQVRAAAFFAARVDSAALRRVSRGQAAEQVVSTVALLERRKERTAGGSTLETTEVEVEGSSASVDGCLVDRSVGVNAASGQPIELPAGPVRARGTLERSGPTWRVVSVTVEGECA